MKHMVTILAIKSSKILRLFVFSAKESVHDKNMEVERCLMRTLQQTYGIHYNSLSVTYFCIPVCVSYLLLKDDTTCTPKEGELLAWWPAPVRRESTKLKTCSDEFNTKRKQEPTSRLSSDIDAEWASLILMSMLPLQRCDKSLVAFWNPLGTCEWTKASSSAIKRLYPPVTGFITCLSSVAWL